LQLGASYAPQGNETKHTRRQGDGTTQFANYNDEDWGIYASLEVVGVGDKLFRYSFETTDDTTSPYFGQEAPFLQGVGTTNWGVTAWTNAGAPGIQYVSVEAEKPAEPATAMPDGNWYTGTIGSDLTGGALSFNAAKLKWSYGSGMGTVTGDDRSEFENGTFSTGAVTGTSQVSSFDGDGFFTETDSGGTTWRGFLFNSGKTSWKMSVGADLVQDLAIGTLGTTAAPDTCDRAGFRLIQGFDMPDASFVTTLPLTSMFTVPNSQRGVGSFLYYPFDATYARPFVYFSDNLAQVDAMGGFKFTDQSGIWYGGISEGSTGSVLSPGDEDEAPFQVGIQFQINF
jgi:hypothetical protein